jgi:hypothetical protein
MYSLFRACLVGGRCPNAFKEYMKVNRQFIEIAID